MQTRKIEGITTPRLWSWSKDYDRHVRREAKSLAKGHGRNRRDNLEHRAVQYACWLAARDGIDAPVCGENVGVTYEHEYADRTNAKGAVVSEMVVKAVVWRRGETHGSGFYGPRVFRPSRDPEDDLLRVDLPNWDADPEAPPVQRIVTEPPSPEESTMTKHYVAYYRVSTDRQGKSGLGLEAQRQAVTDYLAGNGAVVIEDFTEVESGKKADRPELAKALAACKRHKAILVIAKLDRLARNVAFIANLMDSGVEFVAVDMPDANRLTIHILAAVAEHERAMISRRTKEALAAAKARGTKLGNPNPKAASAKGAAARKAQADRHAVNVLPVVQQIQGAGITTLKGIADSLNARGVASATGGDWHPSTVRRVLQRAG